RLAAIDAVRVGHLRELRDRILAVIEGYLEPRQALRTAPAGEEFHFMDAVSFVLPTRHRAASLAEFAETLTMVGGASIAYHLFESRLRDGAEENDFSRWLEGELGERGRGSRDPEPPRPAPARGRGGRALGRDPRRGGVLRGDQEAPQRAARGAAQHDA